MRVIIANILAIYRKELHSYFVSPLSYAIAGGFWFIAGVLFLFAVQSAFGAAANAAAQGQPVDVPYLVLQEFLGGVGLLSVLVILPILSMGLYAEERKRGTLELLATSPLTNWVVAVGKLLGVLTFYISLILPLGIYEAIVFSAATPPMPFFVPLLAHAGLILLAAAVLSLGMFVSSLTDSTVLAAFLTFVLVLVLWLIEGIVRLLPTAIGNPLAQLSLLRHFGTLVQGVVDTSGLVLFATYIILGLFLTAQSIEALRFQRS